MKQYIISWTVTVDAIDIESALQSARDLMAGGDVGCRVEEIPEEDRVAL